MGLSIICRVIYIALEDWATLIAVALHQALKRYPKYNLRRLMHGQRET